jgi:hypothetical protein
VFEKQAEVEEMRRSLGGVRRGGVWVFAKEGNDA